MPIPDKENIGLFETSFGSLSELRCVEMAARSTLRLLPLLAHIPQRKGRRLLNSTRSYLKCFRKIAVCRLGASSDDLLNRVVSITAGASQHSDELNDFTPTADFIIAAVESAHFSLLYTEASLNDNAVVAASNAVTMPISAPIKIPAFFDAIDSQSTFDEDMFGEAVDDLSLAKSKFTISLMSAPLWQSGMPMWFLHAYEKMKVNLRSAGQGWSVWTDWYDAILAGNPTPGGEELELYRVTLDSEEDWAKGPAHVNALIKKKQEEIEARNAIDSSSMVTIVDRDADTIREFLQTPKLKRAGSRLAFDFIEGDQTPDPLAERQHAQVQKQVQRLSDRAPRLDNTHRELASDIRELKTFVDRPFTEAAAHDVEIWNLSLAIAEHLEADSKSRLVRDPNIPLLDEDDRRALDSTLTRLAPWVRLLPNSARLDSEYREYKARQQSLEAVEKLFSAQDARIKFLEDGTKALLLTAIKTARGSTEQAVKARGIATEGAKAIAKEGTLLSRRGLFSKLGVAFGIGVAGGIGKKVGESIAEETELARDIGDWVDGGKDAIIELFGDFPADFQAALKRLLESESAPDLPDDTADI